MISGGKKSEKFDKIPLFLKESRYLNNAEEDKRQEKEDMAKT